jgi:putative phosphoesterase
VLVVVSDTHGRDDHRLVGRSRTAVADADRVVHAGDFTTESVLQSFRATAESFHAVHGNRDAAAVTDRLPATRQFSYGDVHFVLTHRQRGGDTGLAMLGRERGADVVIHGHSHRPRVTEAGPVTLLNPGSHAEPRGAPATHAEIESTDRGIAGRIVGTDGGVIDQFTCQVADPGE